MNHTSTLVAVAVVTGRWLKLGDVDGPDIRDGQADFFERAEAQDVELLLHPEKADNMTGFDNGILVAYGMCLPCPLQEFYQMAPEHQPTHFMRGTAAEIWGTDTHEVMYMYTTAADWDTEH